MREIFVAILCLSLLAVASVAPGEPEQKDIFIGGEGGYNTYRIPAIVVSEKGTLLAFCEGRKYSRADHGFVHLVLKRSFDMGATWEPMQVIHREGWHTIGNPSPVVDKDTGTIWLPFCRDNRRVFVTRSEDDGATWAEPREITRDVKLASWAWYATGPGHAIQLESGRMIVPCDHTQGLETYSHVIYSDNNGETWKLGGTTDGKTNECMLVETIDRGIYVNMRNLYGENLRAYSTSLDEGITWSPVKQDPALVCPVCQASVIRLTDNINRDKNRMLFLNPASSRRRNMTIRVSYDEGRTWPVSRVIHPGPAAYSDMVVLPDMTIGCLYERGDKKYWEKITFTRISIGWITEGQDKLSK